MHSASAKIVREPQRRCFLSHQHSPDVVLFRVVLDEQNAPWIDVRHKAPGRGVYVAAERELITRFFQRGCLEKAFRGKSFAGFDRSQQQKVLQAAFLAYQRQIFELLGSARRAGLVTIGFQPAILRLADADASLWFVANDASPRTKRLVDGMLPADSGGSAKVEPQKRVAWFGSKVELGKAVGREQAGVLVVRPSSIADRLKADYQRVRALGTTEKDE